MHDTTEVADLHADRDDNAGGDEGIFDEDLVEEISIDGMCGVY